MKIKLTPQFEKQFKEYISKDPLLKREFRKTLNVFIEDRFALELRNHPLKGKLKGMHSISMNYSFRIIYIQRGEDIILFRIGPHEKVYS